MKKSLLDLPYTTREERVAALVELKERASRAESRNEVDAIRLEKACIESIAEEMAAYEEEALIERAEAVTQDSTLGRPSLAKKNSTTAS